MDMKIVGITVSVLVSLVVLAGVLMPILDDATATTDKFTNEGLPYIKATSDDSYTLVWDPATPDKATVNGSEYTIWKTGDGTRSISLVMIPDKGIIRYNMNGSGVFNSNQVVGLGTLNATNGFTFTYTGGTYTITNPSSQTITGTSDIVYAIGNGGNFVLKNSADRSYLLDDSEIFGMGVTNVIAWNNGFQIEGDNFQIDGDVDNVEVSAFSTGTATFTISNVADDLAEVSDYKDLFTLNKVTFTATGTPTEGDPVSVDATYSYFLVPNEVTAERSVHFTDNQNALLAVIPMLVIVAILIGVVALVIRSRLD